MLNQNHIGFFQLILSLPNQEKLIRCFRVAFSQELFYLLLNKGRSVGKKLEVSEGGRDTPPFLYRGVKHRTDRLNRPFISLWLNHTHTHSNTPTHLLL